MKVIIPLAGKGTRLRPHTYTKAKPLMYLAGNTVLGHILDELKGKKEIEEIIFITGYLGEQIEEYVEKRYDFRTRYIEQKELKGQAHAVKLAEEFVEGDVVIWFVDTISDADITLLKKIKEDGAIYVKEVDNPRRFGQVHSNKDGIVTEIKEKADPPISNLVNIGLYYVKNSKMMFECINELIENDMQTKGEFYLMDAFQLMIGKGARFKTLEIDVWKDCGKPDAVLDANRYFLDNGKTRQEGTENSLIIPPVYIEKGAIIKDSIIGPHVTIAKDASISDSIVRESIIGKKSVVEHANLSESIIGDFAYLHGTVKRLNIGDSSEIFYE